MKLINRAGNPLNFKDLNFIAPAGEFEVDKELAEKLLLNDAIKKVKSKKE